MIDIVGYGLFKQYAGGYLCQLHNTQHFSITSHVDEVSKLKQTWQAVITYNL